MKADIEAIKELRKRTGAGVNAVRDALENSETIEAAIQYLRAKGEAKAAKRAGKSAENGILGVYVHNDSRMTVVVEVASETDFAAKSEDLKQFANDIALHIAAVNTQYITPESIPAEIIEKEKAAGQADVEGKPAEIAEKILAGKLEKFYKENCLVKQQLFTDDSKTVEDYINELVAKVGEKIEVTKFVRMQIAQPTISCSVDLTAVE